MIRLPPEVSAPHNKRKMLASFSQLAGRIGLFGGSFDPIHSVHLEIGTELLGQVVDHVVYIPAAQNPLKTIKPTSDSDRLAMVLLAIEEIDDAYVSSIELDRGAISYTAETLEAITQQKAPGASLFLIIGSDCLPQLPQWRNIERIAELATIICVQRDQVRTLSQWRDYIDVIDVSAQLRDRLKRHFVVRRPNTTSSTGIRTYLQQSRTGAELSDKVADYIDRKRLYRG